MGWGQNWGQNQCAGLSARGWETETTCRVAGRYDVPHEKGTLSMARSSDPNSANSQFFICFDAAPSLDRNYTVFGKVIEGFEHVEKIKKGDSNNNGAVSDPDKIISFRSL